MMNNTNGETIKEIKVLKETGKITALGILFRQKKKSKIGIYRDEGLQLIKY